jgi:DNA-directed RNA polymerase specialized sigma24 family protein
VNGLRFGGLAAAVVERLAAAQQVVPLDSLSAEQRRALELRVLDDLDYAAIGERLEITPAGARTRVFRALGTLRAQMGRSGS